MTTKSEAAQALTILRAALPKQQITTAQFRQMVAVWAEILGDLPFQLVKLAIKDWCSNGTPFFPSVGQIRQSALDLTASAADRLTPGEAWDQVCRAFRLNGHWATPEWSHPNVEKAVKAVGGWAYLCQSENPMADRARFMDAFQCLQDRDDHDRRMLPDVRDFVGQHRQLAVSDELNKLTAALQYDRDRPRD